MITQFLLKTKFEKNKIQILNLFIDQNEYFIFIDSEYKSRSSKVLL